MRGINVLVFVFSKIIPRNPTLTRNTSKMPTSFLLSCEQRNSSVYFHCVHCPSSYLSLVFVFFFTAASQVRLHRIECVTNASIDSTDFVTYGCMSAGCRQNWLLPQDNRRGKAWCKCWSRALWGRGHRARGSHRWWPAPVPARKSEIPLVSLHGISVRTKHFNVQCQFANKEHVEVNRSHIDWR